MAEQPPKPAAPTASKMDKLVALCRRRGFIFQSSEIYGGINGFWDYGPLGVELKRNLKNAWWHDIVRAPGNGPDGNLLDMVGLDCTIIMNPKVWVASGHVGGFNDPMVDDKETKQRFRADHLWVREAEGDKGDRIYVAVLLGSQDEAAAAWDHYDQHHKLPAEIHGRLSSAVKSILKGPYHFKDRPFSYLNVSNDQRMWVIGEGSSKAGSLTEPRQFNLMFETYVGAVRDETALAYLRPETAQGIFVNFRNVVDTSRVKVPFGIAQIGKAFRNEVTPRNYTFRSREFEQMEIEFFIRPDTAHEWYKFWRDERFKWWQSIGLSSANLQLREHEKDELAHYAKEGAGTSDIEYKFPFTDPGFGELEGVAHRSDFDLRQHAQHSGLGDKLKYFDQELQVKLLAEGMPKEQVAEKCKYFPHVIEPSAGADRGTLALLCEAYTDDPDRPSGVVMKFHPRMAPIKAGIFPLVDKDGMPEIAEKIYRDLRTTWNVQLDNKQNIGKRYARMDEAGTPFCFTVDSETLQNQTVTVRHRDTLQQERVSISNIRQYLADKVGAAQ
ncbi:MAG TPA: glycine--tRNA ligase [Phycisphaerae bacterium]|nr:glycine--tRNA ligase [Phycisphaerae bacterium]